MVVLVAILLLLAAAVVLTPGLIVTNVMCDAGFDFGPTLFAAFAATSLTAAVMIQLLVWWQTCG